MNLDEGSNFELSKGKFWLIFEILKLAKFWKLKSYKQIGRHNNCLINNQVIYHFFFIFNEFGWGFKFRTIEGPIWELAKFWVVRNIQWTNIYKICQFLEPNSGIPNLNFFRNLLIFQLVKISNFENSKHFPLWENPNILNSENFLNLQFEKFQKFSIRRILKMSNLWNSKICWDSRNLLIF